MNPFADLRNCPPELAAVGEQLVMTTRQHEKDCSRTDCPTFYQSDVCKQCRLMAVLWMAKHLDVEISLVKVEKLPDDDHR